MYPGLPDETAASAATASTAADSAYAVELLGVTKRFGPVVANDGVELRVRPRSVHALVGENGAGKSTLMKILAGVLRPDEGTIRLGGEQVCPARRAWTAAEAIRRGIGMVYQHFMLIEPLTVAENLVLGSEPLRRGLLDVDAASRAVERLGAEYALPVDPRARVADLTVGERQRVEILKLLFRGAEILVLDEPTAVLTPSEVQGLFKMLRAFVDQGRTVLLITHKLDEVMEISQRVTILRRGQTVGAVDTADTSPRDLAHRMVGRPVSLGRPRAPDADDAPSAHTPPALAIAGLVVEQPGGRALDDVSLEVRPGEVLGVAGVQGNGQRELLEAIAGLRSVDAGRIVLRSRPGGSGEETAGEPERDITALSVRERFAAGLAHIPEDRHERGLVLDLSVAENLILGRHHGYGGRLGLDRRAVQTDAAELADRFDIRPRATDTAARNLSGGNQQKIVVAREMTRRPAVLLAGQPTRGVDIGAVEAIHDTVRAARDEGLGVLLVSADLAELLALSDRIAVLHRGRIVATLDAATATPAQLGELMLGVQTPPEGSGR